MNSDPVLSADLGWLILALFSVVWIWLGWWLGRRAQGLDGFMLAGRKVGLALGTATAMATWVTSNTTMAAPQLAFQMGIWGMVGYSLGSIGLILFAPLAKRIRELMPQGFTSGDFIRLRYGNLAWRVFLVISLFYAFGWLISLGMAGGVLINALTGIDYHIGMSVIVAVCVSYTLLGGLRAVIGTDFLQSLIILTGIVILAVLAISKVGVDTMHEQVLMERPELLNLLFPAAIMFLFNNLLFGVGEIFHSNVWWSRAFAFREGVGFKAYLIAGLFWTPVPIVAGFLALTVPALNINVPTADMVGPLVAGELLGAGGAVLVFIVVFSALASSLDSLLAATSDLVLTDLYRGHLRPQAGEEELVKAARWITLGLGLVTWLLCWPRITTLAELLYFTGAFVASTIWPVAAGLYWRSINPMGATLAMALGTLVGLLSYFMIGFYVAALVAAAVSMTLVLLTTWLAPRSFDWQMLDPTPTPAREA
ncbi:MAG: sodium:solute symporter family protein [Candidatus Thiodiazotropha lotti]|uniref:Sodium:solute symporter family protein n=1 Tax=Candidatus Thiodiazotropha lotti TaxID=2792787 RepID=A0A9E4N2G2_9GAMM|nr:sodium:solute symporter family protein [Candidatus Thiodiazotropha lotti]ODC01141.1 urea transporter [Candidatus Thiodiazotropha endoloripes]MCG7920902.1 sodium:solute symporter family protein [Candidatus Thiodiazotropha lotti]MCG7930107.1 sodium:solute symporter family protein [Candidatus Thiodiazotropha lotti]MCG7940805.1 sodium:solute symporter family protein [Candidatus Thiodiazotropha lotti]